MRKIVRHAAIMLVTVAGVVALASLLGCNSEPTPSGSFQVERVFPGLSFQEMTNLVQPNDTSGLIFVTE